MSSTAILLFSREPHEEARYKNFSLRHHRKTNIAISKKLLNRTFTEIRKSKLDFFAISGQQQRGATFGERLANALDAVFEKGYSKVMVVGSDAPQLTSRLLLKAAAGLQDHNMVLGPDERGGIYLLGITKNSYSKDQLIDISWKTGSVCRELLRMATSNACTVEMLHKLRDINDADDLQRFIQSNKSPHALIHVLKGIIASFTGSSPIEPCCVTKSTVQLNISQRGPPLQLLRCIAA